MFCSVDESSINCRSSQFTDSTFRWSAQRLHCSAAAWRWCLNLNRRRPSSHHACLSSRSCEGSGGEQWVSLPTCKCYCCSRPTPEAPGRAASIKNDSHYNDRRSKCLAKRRELVKDERTLTLVFCEHCKTDDELPISVCAEKLEN